MNPAIRLALLLLLATSAAAQNPQLSSSSPAGTTAGESPEASESRPFLHGETGRIAGTVAHQSETDSGELRKELESLKVDLGGRRGLIEIPPAAPAGWWPGVGNSALRFLDDRGNSMPDSNGAISSGVVNGFKVGFANGVLFRATETDQGSPDHYTGFSNVQFHYTAARGGRNDFTGRGQKTDYFNVLATSEMRTVGQKSGVVSRVFSYSNGDTMGLQSYITQFGGYDTSGDEQTEGIRIQAQQGSAAVPDTGGIFEGIVKAIDGARLTYLPTHDENTLGEHRIIRDLDRSYSKGSVVSIANLGGVPNAIEVTGSGTYWTKLTVGSHTQWNNVAAGGNVSSTTLAFCFDPLKGDGYDTCFPVASIVDNTHLTLYLAGVGTQQNTPWPQSWPGSGSYKMYSAAWPVAVNMDSHTVTAPDLSAIAVGDHIDQVLAYNMQVEGEWIALSRHIGFPGKGAGIHIVNWGASGSPSMGYGVGISGGFDSALALQASNQRSGVPSYLATFYSEPASGIILDSAPARMPSPEVSLWRARDASGATHVMLSFLRQAATTCLLDTTLCASARGSVTVKQLAQTETNDYAGIITISGTSRAEASFTMPFQTVPICSLTPTSNPAAIGPYWVTATKSSVTANITRSGNISFDYICVGNPH